MTKQETAQILTIIHSEYPHDFSKLDKRQIDAKYEFWCMEFANDSFESVFTALRMYIESGEEFAPNIGKLRAKMRMQVEQDEMSEGEAWALVSKACRNGSYGYKKEFEKLPPLVQKAVGRAEQLRDWAAMEENTVQSVVASNFKRDFRAVKEREKETSAYSPALKNVLNNIRIGTGEQNALPERKDNDL